MPGTDNLQALRQKNPALRIEPVTHADFSAYGTPVEHKSVPGLVRWLQVHTPVKEGVKYVASDEGAEALPAHAALQRACFGGLLMQTGWCNGTNTVLNALEWHNSGEVDVAASPAVLLLATLPECENGRLHTSRVRGFYMEAGQAVLLYATTLHFAPCAVQDSGFRMGILLPRGTNLPLAQRAPGDGALWMQNKWLMAHEQAAHLVRQGAFVGLDGPFLEVSR